MRLVPCLAATFAMFMLCAAATVAAQPDPYAASLACRDKENDVERLRCYDDHFGRGTPEAAAQKPATAAVTTTIATTTTVRECEPDREPQTHLERTWGLRSGCPIPLTELGWHRPTYIIVRRTSDTNDLPRTPSLGPAFPQPAEYDPMELKFQLSFKSEFISPRAFRNIPRIAEGNAVADAAYHVLGNSRLWFAYTQQSNWQAFDKKRSRPFRESNYEPELIWTFDATSARDPLEPKPGFKLLNIGFAHQSNGRGGPQSRSWNRLYVQPGFDLPGLLPGDLSLLVRKWWRESEEDDDHPDIKDYYGRGDLVLRWEPPNGHKVALLLRHNLRLNPGRGFAQLDWSIPLPVTAARLHVQATSGYGESLIDYNHNQKTLGVGFSFGKW